MQDIIDLRFGGIWVDMRAWGISVIYDHDDPTFTIVLGPIWFRIWSDKRDWDVDL